MLAVLLAPLFGGVGQAQAQNVDWVLNISDAGSDPTPAGGTISYTMSVANNGFDPAPPTTISLTIPAGATFTGATGTITGCAPVPAPGPATVVCNVPVLASTASASLVANVLTSVSGSVTLAAAVPTAGDVDPANNAESEPTTVTAGADISLGLTGPTTAAAGSLVTYSFAATNNGPDPATNVVVQYPVPTGITNVTPPAGCTLAAGTYSCTIAGPIAVGATVNRDFQGQISAGSGSTITSVGSVGGGTPVDPIALNNGATLNTTVTAGSDLRITVVLLDVGAILSAMVSTGVPPPSRSTLVIVEPEAAKSPGNRSLRLRQRRSACDGAAIGAGRQSASCGRVRDIGDPRLAQHMHHDIGRRYWLPQSCRSPTSISSETTTPARYRHRPCYGRRLRNSA